MSWPQTIYPRTGSTFSYPEHISETHGGCRSYCTHTHLLGGVDVPFVGYDIYDITFRPISLGQNSFIYFNISDIYITIKQNVRFQVEMCPEKFQVIVDQIKNGRLSAIIDFNMRNVWKLCRIARPFL